MSKSTPSDDELALSSVTMPTNEDVICGRGGVALRHIGNSKYRNIVNQNKKRYALAKSRREKTNISRQVVATVREYGGRFLEREDGKICVTKSDVDESGNPVTWRDIGDIRAVEKTSQALREGRSKILKNLGEDASPDATEYKVPTQMQHALPEIHYYPGYASMPCLQKMESQKYAEKRSPQSAPPCFNYQSEIGLHNDSANPPYEEYIAVQQNDHKAATEAPVTAYMQNYNAEIHNSSDYGDNNNILIHFDADEMSLVKNVSTNPSADVLESDEKPSHVRGMSVELKGSFLSMFSLDLNDIANDDEADICPPSSQNRVIYPMNNLPDILDNDDKDSPARNKDVHDMYHFFRGD